MRKPLIPGQAGSGGSSQASSDGTSGSSAQGGTQNGSAQSAQANEENYYTDPVPEGMPEPVEPQDTAVNQGQSAYLYAAGGMFHDPEQHGRSDRREGNPWFPPTALFTDLLPLCFTRGSLSMMFCCGRCRTIGFIWKRNSLPCITALTWKESITFMNLTAADGPAGCTA